MAHEDQANQSTSSNKKQPYTSPRITEFGDLAKLTEGKTGSFSDGRKRRSGKKKD